MTVAGIPAKTVQASREAPERQRFVAYGTPTGDLPDPVARALEGLLGEVQSLRARVNDLEAQESAGPEPASLDEATEEDEAVTGAGVGAGAGDPPAGEC